MPRRQEISGGLDSVEAGTQSMKEHRRKGPERGGLDGAGTQGRKERWVPGKR